MAGKTMNLVFSIAGELTAAFTSAFSAASKQTDELAEKTKKLSAAQQKRFDLTQIKKLQKAYDDVGKSVKNLSKEIVGTAAIVGGAITAASGAVYGLVAVTAASDVQVGLNAEKIGLAVEAYSSLSAAAKRSKVSEEAFYSGSLQLSKNLAAAMAGNKEAITAFGLASVAYKDAAGNVRNVDDVMMDLARSFSEMPEIGPARLERARSLFGKAGADFIPMLSKGAEQLATYRAEADRFGDSVSQMELDNAKAFQGSLGGLRRTLGSITSTIAHEMTPVITEIQKQISEWVLANHDLIKTKVQEWIKEFLQYLPELIEDAKSVGRGVRDAALSINSIVQSMGGWGPVIKTVAAAWLAYRGIRIGVALGQVVNAVWGLGSALRTALPSVINFVGAWAGRKWATLSTVASGVKWLGLGVLSLAKSFIAALPAIWSFTVALLACPITWIIAGIVALVAAIYLLWKHWDTVVEWLTTAWEFWKEVAASVADAVVAAFEWCTDAVVGAWNYCVDIAKSVGGAIAAAWEWCVDTVMEVITTLVSGIKNDLLAIWNILPGWVQGALTAFYNNFVRGFGLIVDFVVMVGETIVGTVGAIASGIAAVASWIYDKVSAVFSTIAGAILTIGSGIVSAVSWMYDRVVANFAALADAALWIVEKIVGIAASIGSAVVSAASWIFGKISGILTWIYDAVLSTVDAVVNFFSTMWESVKSFFTGSAGEVVDGFRESFVGGLLKAVALFNPTALFMRALNAVVEYLTGFNVIEEGKAVIQSLLDGLGAFSPLDALRRMMDAVIDYISGLGSRMLDLGRALIENLVSGLLDAWNSVKDTVANTIKSIPGFEMAATVAGAVSDAAGTVGGAIGGAASWVGNAVGFAEGGVVTRPTPAIVGEAGPEVIVPVTRPGRAMDLLATAADMMGMGRGGAPGGSIQISYAPTITIAGGGDGGSVKSDVTEALSHSKEEFRRMLQDVLRKDYRLAMR